MLKSFHCNRILLFETFSTDYVRVTFEITGNYYDKNDILVKYNLLIIMKRYFIKSLSILKLNLCDFL